MGASGGIGFEMVRLLAQHPHTATLFAVARLATGNPALQELAMAHAGRIVLIDADITDESRLAAMATSIATHVPSLHLVVNAAGMLHTPTRGPEKTLAQLTLAGLQQSFSVNAFGPILLAKALMPLLRHAEPVVFASLSARVGSITDNRLGGWYSYRAAKAAQNQLLKTLSIELTRLNRRSTVLALHPGTTDTALSKPFQGNVRDDALFAPIFAAQRLLDVIAQRGPGQTGGFYAWDGTSIDW
ncbi:MAG: SDR family NAD(P)-dependent oxidoreductase [Herminiimonas sp.]|nr:SDR family NAD(P)-dependent oxidoreductase [Herminiimonas sp.]